MYLWGLTVLWLLSYDNDGTTRDEIKERFCLTMDFVENYLREVVSQNIPFSDKEKNKLTFEVPPVHRWYKQMRCQLGFIKLEIVTLNVPFYR